MSTLASLSKVDYTQNPNSGSVYDATNQAYTTHIQEINQAVKDLGAEQAILDLCTREQIDGSYARTKEELQTITQDVQGVYGRVSKTFETTKILKTDLESAVKYIEPLLKRLQVTDLQALDSTSVTSYEKAATCLETLKRESKEVVSLEKHLVIYLEVYNNSLKIFLSKTNPTQTQSWYERLWGSKKEVKETSVTAPVKDTSHESSSTSDTAPVSDASEEGCSTSLVGDGQTSVIVTLVHQQKQEELEEGKEKSEVNQSS